MIVGLKAQASGRLAVGGAPQAGPAQRSEFKDRALSHGAPSRTATG